MNIEDKLIELLEERGFTPVLTPSASCTPWNITFCDNNGELNVIIPITTVASLWWLTETVGDEAPKTPFDSWIVELEGFFKSTYGMSHKDFDDHDWFDEFDNDVSPGDAFREWQMLNEAGTLGG